MSTSPAVSVDMTFSFHHWQSGLGGLPLMLLSLAARADNPQMMLGACGLAALISLLAWINAYRNGKAIADTPTSSIASAAQGYVELQGTTSNQAEYHLVGKSGLTCVWYRWIAYRRDNENRWQEFGRQCSEAIFELTDASGERCLVDPEAAEVVTDQTRTWYQDDMKYVEELLIPGQPLYVLGEFKTLNADSCQPGIGAEVSQLLKSWKQDPAGMLEHFDQNRDGKIDLQEWELARQAAHRQVMAQNRHFLRQPGIHLIGRPKNRQLFLLSNLAPKQLRQRFLLWSWLHLLLFFGTLAAGFWLAGEQGIPG